MKTFRIISLIEGLSLLLLLFIAMPLKYYAGMPGMVFYVGMSHGILFLLYAGFALAVSHRQGWSIGYWLFIFLLGVVPFGFLFVDHKLKRSIQQSMLTESA